MISLQEAAQLVTRYRKGDKDVCDVVEHFKPLHYSIIESGVSDDMRIYVFQIIFQKGKTDDEIVAELQEMTGGRHW